MDRTGPCEPWTDVESVRACGACAEQPGDDTIVDEAIDAAGEVLFVLSGRQFPGACTAVLRPCVRRTPLERPLGWNATWGTVNRAGRWCGCGGGRCGCGPGPSGIDLGVFPIRSIDAITIDGQALGADEWDVVDDRYIIRLPDLDGHRQHWPCVQRLDLPATEPGTFEVTVTYGRDIPALARRAATELACHLALAACGGEGCLLDRRIQTIAGQGVTVQLPGLVDMIGEGRTGLPTVDLFLHTYNPGGVRSRGVVSSPDFGPKAHSLRGTDGS